MTTRAGLAGLLTGLITTIIIYPLYLAWSHAYLRGLLAGSTLYVWIGVAAAVLLMISGGLLAVRWSGSTHPGRCAALGGLAGGLAGTIVFCLWGAATAGWVRLVMVGNQATNAAVCQSSQIEIIATIVRQTLGTFLALFLGGSGLGAAGGWLACTRQRRQVDVFDTAAPQMALNVTITAVLASIAAAGLAAFIYSRLADSFGSHVDETICVKTIVNMPLAVSILLVLISHFVLTMVIPHETRQAEHRCGLDEVKMAAYVGIGASPAFILLLLFIRADLFLNPFVVIVLLASLSMSLKSLHSLLKLVLPRRASFPAPPEGRQKTEARFFGSIAKSRGPRLVALCIGCGLVMVLPLYVPVLSVLINISYVSASSAFVLIPKEAWRLFLIQAVVSSGVITVTIVALSAIYLFYLNLGLWFSKWNSRRSN